MRANTVLGSWARISGLIPEKDVIAFLADKKGTRARELATAAALETEASETGVGEPASSAVEEALGYEDDDLYA